ncbi:hypothetical protein BpHYR1_044369 [Brachionus plicatilis]|uniref:Uncharacterized protein n=1 Tax=Brachionus plicatilis TaxID=10195 RepID=A0A3M7SSW4_BRAPC|nr:hypothetical protein BpHYR1_044369 [Brachionus plicatilis]
MKQKLCEAYPRLIFNTNFDLLARFGLKKAQATSTPSETFLLYRLQSLKSSIIYQNEFKNQILYQNTCQISIPSNDIDNISIPLDDIDNISILLDDIDFENIDIFYRYSLSILSTSLVYCFKITLVLINRFICFIILCFRIISWTFQNIEKPSFNGDSATYFCKKVEENYFILFEIKNILK